MAITFTYTLGSFYVMQLIESSFMILVYLMLFLSSRDQEKNCRKPHLLRYAGITGIIIASIYAALPTIVCTPPITGLCYALGLIKRMIFYLPFLVSLGIFLFLFGKENKEIYGNILYIIGIFWILAFFGYLFTLLALRTGLWILLIIGIFGYLAFPAFILMIVHGAKFKDRYFILSGAFYIISWLSPIILPMFITF